MLPIIEETALRILAQTPGPVVRYRLLRDVLTLPTNDPELQKARRPAIQPLDTGAGASATARRQVGGFSFEEDPPETENPVY
jgi:hypothetical protein